MVKKFQVTLALMLSVALLTLVGCGTKSSLRGSIVGYVLDSQTGIGISGATVTTSPSTSSVITDINGAFSINDINAGVYTVTANASDYNGKSVYHPVFLVPSANFGGFPFSLSAGEGRGEVFYS